MPARSTIFVWLDENEEFASWYTIAKDLQIDWLLNEVREIVDDSSNARTLDGIRRVKAQAGARNWHISKLMPKKYR